MPTFTKKTIVTAQDEASFYHGGTNLETIMSEYGLSAKGNGLTDNQVIKDSATLTISRLWLDQAAAENYVAFVQNLSRSQNMNISVQIVDNT